MEDNITERIKNARLTKAQLKIAEYVIQNPERVGMSSSMEVAKAIGVSDASVIRFARAIGYEGFTDLKNDIYSSLANQAAGGVNSLSLVERFHSNQAEFGGGSRAEAMKLLRYNLERTFQINSEETFDAVVSLLAAAEHRYILGFRGCLGTAIQCAWLLRFLVDHVVSVSDEGPGGIGSVQDIGPEDCVLFFTLSRYYKADLKLAQLAKSRGAKICVITDSVLSPLSEYADAILLVETRASGFFNSTAALHMVSEYLVTKLAQECQDHYKERAGERDALTQDLRL